VANVKAAVYAHLKTKTGVTGLIGTSDNMRAYPGRVPDNAGLPYVQVHDISGTHEQMLSARAGVVDGRVQIDCWGGTPLEAYNVADAIRLAMDHIAYGTSVGGVTIQGSHALDTSEVNDIATGLEAADRYGYRVEVNVWYQE